MRVLTIFFFLISNTLLAQVKGSINYELKINNQFGRYPLNYVVIFNNKESIELAIKQNIDEDKILESSTEGNIQKIKVVKSSKPDFIFKDYKASKIINSENIGFSKYLVIDTLNNFQWKITTDHKLISGYDCLKANTTFRGRNYEAWFTEAIPIPNGPWKFGGLPGLILEVYDTEKIYNFKMTGINVKDKIDENVIVVPNQYNMKDLMSYDKFMVLYRKKEKDYEAQSRVVIRTENSTSSSKFTLPTRIEKY
jgi:GLPGLI family protein